MKEQSSIRSLVAAGVVGAIATVAAPAAESHHSFAMYDQSKTETLTGRLTRFIPGANHAQLLFERVDQQGRTVTDDSGEAVVWGVETGPAARIADQGVTVDAFPEGTIITVSLHPLRDGSRFGSLSGAIVKCGTGMPDGGCTAETGRVFMQGSDQGAD